MPDIGDFMAVREWLLWPKMEERLFVEAELLGVRLCAGWW
jgi:hypothetical protein